MPVACTAVRPATISNLEDRTTEDARTGAMRSIQAADLSLPEAALRELWSPMHLERLARTYWRFLTRVTLGLVRVRYSRTERSIVLLGLRPRAAHVRRARVRAGARPRDRALAHRQWSARRPSRSRRRGAPADRRPPPPRRGSGRARGCTSRSRSQTSTPRSPRDSAGASTTRPRRASTCSSPTDSCARSRGWTWPTGETPASVSGGSPTTTPPTRSRAERARAALTAGRTRASPPTPAAQRASRGRAWL